MINTKNHTITFLLFFFIKKNLKYFPEYITFSEDQSQQTFKEVMLFVFKVFSHEDISAHENFNQAENAIKK